MQESWVMPLQSLEMRGAQPLPSQEASLVGLIFMPQMTCIIFDTEIPRDLSAADVKSRLGDVWAAASSDAYPLQRWIHSSQSLKITCTHWDDKSGKPILFSSLSHQAIRWNWPWDKITYNDMPISEVLMMIRMDLSMAVWGLSFV